MLRSLLLRVILRDNVPVQRLVQDGTLSSPGSNSSAPLFGTALLGFSRLSPDCCSPLRTPQTGDAHSLSRNKPSDVFSPTHLPLAGRLAPRGVERRGQDAQRQPSSQPRNPASGALTGIVFSVSNHSPKPDLNPHTPNPQPPVSSNRRNRVSLISCV